MRLLSVCGKQMPASENNQIIKYGKSKRKLILMAKVGKGRLRHTLLPPKQKEHRFGRFTVCVNLQKRQRSSTIIPGIQTI